MKHPDLVSYIGPERVIEEFKFERGFSWLPLLVFGVPMLIMARVVTHRGRARYLTLPFGRRQKAP